MGRTQLPGAACEVWPQVPLTHLAQAPAAHSRGLHKRGLPVPVGQPSLCHRATMWGHLQAPVPSCSGPALCILSTAPECGLGRSPPAPGEARGLAAGHTPSPGRGPALESPVPESQDVAARPLGPGCALHKAATCSVSPTPLGSPYAMATSVPAPCPLPSSVPAASSLFLETRRCVASSRTGAPAPLLPGRRAPQHPEAPL